MSARVFNPVVMSEMRRILPGVGGSGVVACSENGSQPSASFTTIERSFGREVARVRRDLFGPVDHEESRRFVENELAAQSERDADRWGFDFQKGSPRKSGPGTARFMWEKVTPKMQIHKTYGLGRMQYLSRCAADDAPTHGTTATEVKVSQDNSVTAATTNNKQSRITDFLQNRKRLLTPVKVTSTSTETEISDIVNMISYEIDL
ncbi:hypothetical protein C0J52_27421 [Blattella germanica]|nr:hypothetical protein C0J52_27421 [Blattella germanica]